MVGGVFTQIHPGDACHMTWPTKPVPQQQNTDLVFISGCSAPAPCWVAPSWPPALPPCVIRIESSA